MVEASLCLLLFMASAVGIIDVSLGIFVRETMQHAVREGTRFAITYQKVDGLCQIPSIKKIVKLHSMDFLTDAQVDAHVKVKFYLPDGSAESGENKPGHLVEVSVENYEWKWIAPIWRSNESLKITVRSSDKMEGLPGSGGAPCMGS
jgi:hypothetical protein